MADLRKRDRHRSRNTPRRFCGVDGEGGQAGLLPVQDHHYYLLRAGEFVLETGEPLSWVECLKFLAELPTDRIWVSYFFDYDVTMMLRDAPEERVRRLLDTDCRRIPGKPCSSFPVDIGRFQVDYLPHKEFRVRQWIGPGPKDYSAWVIIHDTGTFFQSSFVLALTKWFADEPQLKPVIDQIAEGKNQRNNFGAVTEYEREYNRLEIAMLERLMEKFRDLCSELDMRPLKWQGPGNLVSAVFRREKLPRNNQVKLFDTHPELIRMANAAYYGGRFEVSTFGDIEGTVYQYDINSAYANTYRNLPCLLHGSWTRVGPGKFGQRGRIRVLDVTFRHDSKFHWGSLPVRTPKGTLIFPRVGRGFYWSPELDNAARYGVHVESHGGWEYRQTCECRYFGFVDDMYAARARIGKDVRGLPLKIVLASTYGKLAQSVGCAPYSNPIWSGLIVSTVRAQLADAALRNQRGCDVLMLATDGVFSRSPIDLPIGERLGEWDYKEHDGMFIVQSGVYFLPGEDKTKVTKTRGVPQSKVIASEDEFRQVWSRYLAGGSLEAVPVHLRNFIGLRLAIARNSFGTTAGQWVPQKKSISFDWNSKRTKPHRVGSAIVTEMIPGSPQLTSVPYDRIIGGIRARERLEYADTPDWGDTL
jgi:hypothetical protein